MNPFDVRTNKPVFEKIFSQVPSTVDSKALEEVASALRGIELHLGRIATAMEWREIHQRSKK